MIEPTTSRFSNAGEVEQIAEYRQFNLLAILAAVLGVLSFGVLLSAFLLVVPLLALMLGAGGLLSFHRNHELGGKISAWFGITLALFFMAWSATQYSVGRCVNYSEANQVVQDWLQLVVDGEKEIAHQAMMSITRRQATGLSVQEYYAMDEEASKAMEEIFSAEPMSELLDLGSETKFSHIKNTSLTYDLESTMMDQIFRVTPSSGEPLNLKISTIRKYNKALGKPSWIVSGAEITDDVSVNVIELFSGLVTRALSN